MGAAGAVLVNGTGSWLATPPPIVPRSTVGAGDSSLAGYLRADVGGAEPPATAADGRRLRQRRGGAARLRTAHARRDRSRCRCGDVDFADSPPTPPIVTPTESIAMTSTASPPIIDAALVLLDVDAGADKQAVIGRLVGAPRRRRSHHRSRRADRGRDGPRRTVGHRAARRYRDPALPVAVCRDGLDRLRAVGAARRLRRTRRARGSRVPDRRARGRRRRAHEAAVQPRASTGAQGLRRSRYATRRRPTRSSALVDEVLNPAEKPEACGAAEKPAADKPKTLVAITACPTGIAHTYMAADSLVAAAKEAGVTLHVETQGSSGSTPLDRVDDRRSRRRHLRNRRRCQGQGALRGQAGGGLGRQARDQRTGQDGRRSACRREQSRTPPASQGSGAGTPRERARRQAVSAGAPAPARSC